MALLGFLRRFAPERSSSMTSGLLVSPFAASGITADRPAIFGSPLGLPGSLGIVFGAEQTRPSRRKGRLARLAKKSSDFRYSQPADDELRAQRLQ